MLRRCMLMAGAGMLVLGATATPTLAAPQPNRGQCNSELARAGLIGRDTNPGHANVIVGTEGDDTFTEAQLTEGVDLICGFGGADRVEATLGSGDVFLGGEGNDSVNTMDGGTFEGGEGIDSVDFMNGGTFNGGAGNDAVAFLRGGTFNGGEGDDEVIFLENEGTTFNGGPGNDSVFLQFAGTFNGGPGNDTVFVPIGGTFNQD